MNSTRTTSTPGTRVRRPSSAATRPSAQVRFAPAPPRRPREWRQEAASRSAGSSTTAARCSYRVRSRPRRARPRTRTLVVAAVLATTIASGAAPSGALLVTRTAQASDLVVRPAGKPRGTVILIHGGAWVWGDETIYAPTARYLARRGWQAVSVDYPLRNLPAAYRHVERVARRYRGRAVAVGFSAGGTMSAWLAGRRLVRAAATICGPADLRVFAPMRVQLMWRTGRLWDWSPARVYHHAERPLLAVGGSEDHLNPPSQVRLYRRRGAHTRIVSGMVHEELPWVRRLALRFVLGPAGKL